MDKQSIIDELEAIATSITGQSGTPFRTGPDIVGESLLVRGMDSLDFIDYLLTIEGRFGYRVSEGDIKANGLTSTAKMAGFLDPIVRKTGK